MYAYVYTYISHRKNPQEQVSLFSTGDILLTFLIITMVKRRLQHLIFLVTTIVNKTMMLISIFLPEMQN